MRLTGTELNRVFRQVQETHDVGEQYSKLQLWAIIRIKVTEAVDTQLAHLYNFAQGLKGFKCYSKLDLNL